MLDFHKANKADVTIACMPVPWEEASRFGLAITDETGRITEFEEKPAEPKSCLLYTSFYFFRLSLCFFRSLLIRSTGFKSLLIEPS